MRTVYYLYDNLIKMNITINLKTLILLVTMVVSGQNLLSQTTNTFTPEELEIANTAKSVNYLNLEEKEVIRYINLVRMNGEKFFDSYIQPYIDRYNAVYSPKIKPNNKYVKSLKTELYSLKSLPLLIPNEKLCLSATYHAKDMGKSGKTGHNSSDGASFAARMKKLIGTEYYLSENCDYGFDKGIDIVCDLLIDDGIVSLGHRKNILDTEIRLVGVSIQNHKVYKFNCVIDFYANNNLQ